MYHNWYEIYVIGRQMQKDLYQRAEEARRADDARMVRREEKRQARKGRSRPRAAESGPEDMQTAPAS